MVESKYHNVIVIGCDKTGKSTLINNLLSVMDMNYFKGDAQKTPETALLKASEYLRSVRTKPTLLDRFNYPDDLVYHPVMAGEPLPPFILKKYFTYVVPQIMQENTAFIYCMASKETIAERFIQEREQLISIDMIEAILDNYEVVLDFLQASFPVLILNSDTTDPELMAQYAIEFIGLEE